MRGGPHGSRPSVRSRRRGSRMKRSALRRPTLGLAAWKGDRGVPAHVMLTLLRRRLREHNPELMQATFPAARLQRAQDMLKAIWARAGAAGGKHPTWRLADGLLRMARVYMDADRSKPDRSQLRHDQRAMTVGCEHDAAFRANAGAPVMHAARGTNWEDGHRAPLSGSRRPHCGFPIDGRWGDGPHPFWLPERQTPPTPLTRRLLCGGCGSLRHG
jgi:hypothetical protein